MASGDFVKSLGGNVKQEWLEDAAGDHHLSTVPTGLDASGNAQRLDDAASRSLRVYQAGAGIIVPTDIQRILRTQAVLTTTALGSSATYTGDTLDARAYRYITGRAFADQAGTLYVEHSDDGTTWDVSDTIAVAASTVVVFEKLCYLYYLRLRYVNGATAQGTFRLGAWLRAV